MDISVIIVNYNTTGHLSNCLNSIIKYIKGIQYEIIVVDNSSPDREIENYPKKFPTVKFLFRNVNDGFGAGCDFGVNNSTGKYISFLNPDIVLKSNCLKQFYEFMGQNGDVGVCSGILVDNDDKPIYTFNKFPGVYWEVTEALLGNGEKKIDKLLKEKNLNGNLEPFKVDWLIGASMFMKRITYNKVGGFDKDLFLYCEDVDLQKKICELGYKIMCLPQIKIEHFTKSSVRSFDGDDIYQLNMHKSKLIYMKKHMNIFQRIIIHLSYITGISIRIFVLPFRRKFAGHKNDKFKQLLTLLRFYIIPKYYLMYNIN